MLWKEMLQQWGWILAVTENDPGLTKTEVRGRDSPPRKRNATSSPKLAPSLSTTVAVGRDHRGPESIPWDQQVLVPWACGPKRTAFRVPLLWFRVGPCRQDPKGRGVIKGESGTTLGSWRPLRCSVLNTLSSPAPCLWCCVPATTPLGGRLSRSECKHFYLSCRLHPHSQRGPPAGDASSD